LSCPAFNRSEPAKQSGIIRIFGKIPVYPYRALPPTVRDEGLRSGRFRLNPLTVIAPASADDKLHADVHNMNRPQ
jgi:hypothetical protein